MTASLTVGNQPISALARYQAALAENNDNGSFLDSLRELFHPEEKDDGKIGLFESLKAIKNGAVQEVKQQTATRLTQMAKHPIKTTLLAGLIGGSIALAASVFGMPLVMAGLGIWGLVCGIKNLVKDACNIKDAVKRAKSATTDEEKKLLMEDIGKNGLHIAEDVGVIAISGLQTVRAGAKIVGTASQVESSLARFQTEVRTSVESTSDSLYTALDRADQVYNGRYDSLLTGTKNSISVVGEKVNRGIDFSLSASNEVKDDASLILYRMVKDD